MTEAAAGPLKIVRVIARLNVGGPARHVVLLNEGLRRRGQNTLLVHGSTSDGEASFETLAAAADIPVRKVPELGRRIRVSGDVRAFAALLAIMFRERPDIVHTHTAKAGALGRVAAAVYNGTRPRRRRCAVVHTFHGHVLEGYFPAPWTTVVRGAERVLSRLTDRVIAISPAQRRDLVERFGIAPGSRTVVIPLGLDLQGLLRADGANMRETLAIGRDQIVIGFVGRFVPIKNLETLVRAFEMMRADHPDAVLLLAGDGPARPHLDALASTLGISSAVRFLGWVNELDRFYATCDIVALSSLNEGTPVSLIEAMAAGRAVVATAVGGVPDVIDDGLTGRLVAPRSPVALARALTQLADDGRLRRRLGDAARRHVADRYAPERLIGAVDALYREALAEKRAR